MSLATSGKLFRSGRQKLAIIIHPHLNPLPNKGEEAAISV